MSQLLLWLKSHVLVTLIALALLAYAGYVFLVAEEVVPTVTLQRVVTAERGTLRVSVSGSGQVAARSQVDLKSVRAGDGVDVVSVPVKNDQQVKKGQIIAVLDGSDIARSLEQARLNLRSAEIKMKQTEDTYDTERKQDLWNRQLQEVAIATSRLSVADAAERLADYTIRAPFDGIVTGLSVEAGDSLSNETILASVITEEMVVEVSLNEVDAAQIAAGAKATLVFDALPGVTVTGTASKIDTIGVATQGVVAYGAEITLDEQQPKLKPGMSVAADIAVMEKTDVVLVPNEAIVERDGRTVVRVAAGVRREGGENGTAAPAVEERTVVLGATDNIQTEIVSGLEAGERVVVTTSTSRTGGGAETPQAQGNWLNNLLRGGNRGVPGGR